MGNGYYKFSLISLCGLSLCDTETRNHSNPNVGAIIQYPGNISSNLNQIVSYENDNDVQMIPSTPAELMTNKNKIYIAVGVLLRFPPANDVIVLYLSLGGAKIILLQFALNYYLITGDLVTCVFYDEIRNEILLLKHSLSFVSFTNHNVIHSCIHIHGVLPPTCDTDDNHIEHETQIINKYIKGTNTIINEYSKYECVGIDLNNRHLAMINDESFDDKLVIATTTSAAPIAYKHIMEGIGCPTDTLLSSAWNNMIIKAKNIIVKATNSQIELHLKTCNNETFYQLVNVGINCTGSMCNK